MVSSNSPDYETLLGKLEAQSVIAELPLRDYSVTPDTQIREIREEFDGNPDLPGVMIADDEHMLGVLSREWFYQELSKPLALDVYLHRPVQLLLANVKQKPLELDAGLSIQEAAHLALIRPYHRVNELIVVRFTDGNYKLLNIHFLLLAQARLLELANTTILEQKNAADSANHSKSLFLANMSHEIRTPLNGIIGMTRLVLDSKLNPQQREFMELVQYSADSLLDVINDVLDFSKIEAGKLKVEYLPFDIRAFMSETMKPLAFRAHGKELNISYLVDNNVPDYVVGDTTRLRQIITNLVGNAIKFTETGGIHVSVESHDAPDNRLEATFRVVDTGIGIPESRLRSIFDAFEQADGSTTREYGGTGLGLTISARLVELLGGNIQVLSREGYGTEFLFTALFDKDYQTAEFRNVEAPAELSVMVVENCENSSNSIAEIFKVWGIEPFVASSAAFALKTAIDNPGYKNWDLILVDDSLPDSASAELVSQLAATESTRNAHKVLMHDSATLLGDNKPEGVSSFITKPVSHQGLAEQLRLALTNEPGITPHQESRPQAQDSLSILVAEDNPVNQKLASHLLLNAGHSPQLVGDGRAALEAVRETRFDLVLMDIQMPVMDGLEATRMIRQEDKTRGVHTPIIAMTAHAISGDKERCLEAGMDGYVTKPFRLEAFTGEIDRVNALSRKDSTTGV